MDSRTSKPPSGERLLALQVLRFFAAAAVLFVHTLHEGVSFGFLNDAVVEPIGSQPWGNGVDIFFVISGFIMFFIAGGTFGQPGAPGRFIVRRFIRLVPIYWLFTGLMLLAIALFPAEIAHATFNGAHILASFAFVPWVNDTGDVQPVLALGWTLNYEIFFYVMFALALFLPRSIGLAALVGLFMVFVLVHPLLQANAVQLAFWSNPIIIEFLFGIGLAALRRSGLTLSPRLAWLLVAVGTVALFALYPITVLGPYQRVLTAGIPAALIVAGCAFMPFGAVSRFGQALVLGGDASYALYLSHPFSINLVALVMLKTGFIPGWMFVPLAIVAALAGSVIVHLVIEKPLTGWLNAALVAQPKAREKIRA